MIIITDTIHLKDLISISKGKKPTELINVDTDGFLPYLTAAQLHQGDTKQWARGGVVTNPTDILISWDGTVGNVGWGIKGIVGSTIGIISPDLEKVDVAYLGRFLSTKKRLLNDTATGATIKHIRRSVLENLQFPKIPLSEQKRIATILDKSDEICRTSGIIASKRKELLLSTFYELFHGKESDRSDWPVMKIEELALQRKNSMRTGPFGSNLLHSEFVEEGIPVLGIDNVVDNVFKWKKSRFITEEKYNSLKRYTVFPGDLLITIMGTVGRSAVCPDDLPICVNSKHLACISLNQKLVLPQFVSYSLRHDQEILNQIKLKNRGAIMDGLNLTLIKSLKIAVPPIALQNQFVKIMSHILGLGEQIEYAGKTSQSLTQELIT